VELREHLALHRELLEENARVVAHEASRRVAAEEARLAQQWRPLKHAFHELERKFELVQWQVRERRGAAKKFLSCREGGLLFGVREGRREGGWYTNVTVQTCFHNINSFK